MAQPTCVEVLAIRKSYPTFDEEVSQWLKEIDDRTWLIGELLIQRSPGHLDQATWYDDTDDSSYIVSIAPRALQSKGYPPRSPLISVLRPHRRHHIWTIGGKAVCKAERIEPTVTLESATTEFVRAQNPSFETPQIIYESVTRGQSILLEERLPGRDLEEAWPTLSQKWRRHYVQAVADAILEMSQWEGHQIGGVDGKHVQSDYLCAVNRSGAATYLYEGADYGSVPAGCAELGMDFSRIVFFHGLVCPKTILVEVEPVTGKIGLVEFQAGGFYPYDWIYTFAHVFRGNLLEGDEIEDPDEYRSMMLAELSRRGFTKDHSREFSRWGRAKRQSSGDSVVQELKRADAPKLFQLSQEGVDGELQRVQARLVKNKQDDAEELAEEDEIYRLIDEAREHSSDIETREDDG